MQWLCESFMKSLVISPLPNLLYIYSYYPLQIYGEIENAVILYNVYVHVLREKGQYSSLAFQASL